MMDTRKTIFRTLATVTFSSFLGFLATIVSKGYVGTYDACILIVLLGTFLSAAIYLFLFDRIEDSLWSIAKRRSLKNPVIAILKQDDCPRGATRFTSDDWRQRFTEVTRGRRFRIDLINPGQISSKYAVIINPYGEYYPEDDLVELKTLQKIERYIRDGGTFVNTGGFAFFYGWDSVRRREATLAKELEGYQETTLPSGSRLFVPTRLWPATYAFSLVETPLGDFFKVLTTGGDPQTVRVYQEDADRRFVGDISLVGGNDQIREFRAAREPLRNAQPLLRARWPNENSPIVVYPLIALPHNKGCLILGGMAFNTGIEINGVDLDRAERDKVVYAIVNLVESQRSGQVPFDWRRR